MVVFKQERVVEPPDMIVLIQYLFIVLTFKLKLD